MTQGALLMHRASPLPIMATKTRALSNSITHPLYSQGLASSEFSFRKLETGLQEDHYKRERYNAGSGGIFLLTR